MIIIKRGTIPEYYFTCNVCGCEFIADRTECKITEVIKWPETKITETASIACPDCHTELNTYISEEQKDD